MTEREGLLDLVVGLGVRVGEDPQLAVDPQRDQAGLPGQRLDDIDVGVRDTGLQHLSLDLLLGVLHGDLGDLVELLLHLLLDLLLLLLLRTVALLLLLRTVALLLAELLQQLLEGLLLTELLELLQRAAHAHTHGLLLPERLLLLAEPLLPVRLLLLAEALLAERLLLVLLVGRCARELLSLLLYRLAHLRGGVHAGVTFP